MAGEQGAPAIVGIGGVFGELLISNDELIARTGIDSSDAAIRKLTAIEQRYWTAEGTLASDLGSAAAREALKSAGIDASALDGIILTTVTKDYNGGPYTVTEVHRQLGARRDCFVREQSPACTGAVVALSDAADKVRLNPDHTILTVGAELMSLVLNPKDRTTAILFGNAAGATVVQHVEGAETPVFSEVTVPDREAIYAPAGGAAEPGQGADDPRTKLQMDGKRVARHALDIMPEVLLSVLTQDGAINLSTGKIDWDRYSLFVPHQANGRLVEKLWEGLQVPEEKRIMTADRHGNTSSASILLALKEAAEAGRLDSHTRILTTSLGAGITGAAGAVDVKLG